MLISIGDLLLWPPPFPRQFADESHISNRQDMAIILQIKIYKRCDCFSVIDKQNWTRYACEGEAPLYVT